MKVSERVRITINDGVADVVLTRPEKRNAFDDEMFAAITDASAVRADLTVARFMEGPEISCRGRMAARFVVGAACFTPFMQRDDSSSTDKDWQGIPL
jgi:hypothetical protein